MTGTLSLLFVLAAAATPTAPSTSSTPAVIPAAASGENAADPRDKIICKKFLETGSLVKGTRVCKSKAEWDKERSNIRAGYNTSNSCGIQGNGGAC